MFFYLDGFPCFTKSGADSPFGNRDLLRSHVNLRQDAADLKIQAAKKSLTQIFYSNRVNRIDFGIGFPPPELHTSTISRDVARLNSVRNLPREKTGSERGRPKDLPIYQCNRLATSWGDDNYPHLKLVIGTLDRKQEGYETVIEPTDAQRIAIIRQFKPMVLHRADGTHEGKEYSYRLYVPLQVDKGRKYPLLLWLHGAGDAGNNQTQLAHIERALIQFRRDHGPFPGFILAPRAPLPYGWTTRSTETEGDMLAVAAIMVEHTIQDYPIDEDRIVLAGVSSGGDACWEMGIRYPGRFAGIAPMASAGGNEARASQLVGTPIWAFHNVSDPAAPIEAVRRMVASVEAAGGRAKLTEIQDVDHEVWNYALFDYDVLIWLLARRRGEWSWSPYISSADYYRAAVLVGVLAVIAAVSCIELRRRRTGKDRQIVTYSQAKLPDFSELIGENQ